MEIIKHITKKEINEYPTEKFEGKIILIDNKKHVEEAVKEILKHDVVGLDTESRPVFKRGQYHHVSLIQIAIPKKVYLFRINKTGLTDGLIQIFSTKSIMKVGVALYDDIKDLKRIRRFEHQSFVDVSHFTKPLEIVNTGARSLAAIFLGFKISKAQQTSNWENEKLTNEQMSYAATDAWVCLELYQKLETLGHVN